MPVFDGTGPRGQGPMTGRGRGRCVTDNQGNVTRGPVPYNGDLGRGRGGPGRGLGPGRGFGRGRRAGGGRFRGGW